MQTMNGTIDDDIATRDWEGPIPALTPKNPPTRPLARRLRASPFVAVGLGLLALTLVVMVSKRLRIG